MSIDDKSKQMSQDAFWELAKRAGDPPTSILAAGPPMTIDDERAAFIRDLLRVLTSLYSWAGAVVNGQTEDGHDVIELCDGTRVWTIDGDDDFAVMMRHVEVDEVIQWIALAEETSLSELYDVTDVIDRIVAPLLKARIRNLLSGPPEDA